MAVVYYLGRVGRIESGPDAGRYLRVDADPDGGGAYVVRIAADAEITDVVGDEYLAAIEDVPDYFEGLGAPVAWA